MFGVIPRSLWGKLIPPDENNLIPMVTNLFVLRAHGKTMLFDAGFGDTLSQRETKIYSTTSESLMDDGLASLDLATGDIDYVILTHLHTDHAAGTVTQSDGTYVPRFENATYVAGKAEFDEALKPDERTAAVYVPERYQALNDSGRLQLIDSDTELFPGIKAVFTGGHTGGHFGLQMESGGQQVWYYADIYCTRHHMKVAYVPATDLHPLDTMRIKRATLPRIIEEGVVMAFDHDTEMPMARITQDGKQLVATAVT